MNTKKCIVLDLDNTLWGGLAGEEGTAGVVLGLSGAGAGFIAFQQALLDLYARGVILAINSKNNPEDALSIIRTHPNMILKEKHFAASRINWDDKVDNMQSLAQELNIGLDSMVFFDDDPVNRFAVTSRLPQVAAPALPEEPSAYAQFLLGLNYFPKTALTDEDAMRGNLYVTERLRHEAEKSYRTREEFLSDLNLSVETYIDAMPALDRLAQLSEKTNQFNLNKHPYTAEALSLLMQDPNYVVFHARAQDRFGDHGVIAFAVAKKEATRANVDTFLMSCRVIGRGVEDAFLASLAEYLKKEGITEVVVQFTKTDKNAPAESFFEKYFAHGTQSIDTLLQSPQWITRTYGTL